MAFEVTLDKIVDPGSGLVNLPKLFELSEQARRRAKPAIALAKPSTAPSFLFPQPKSHSAIVLRGKTPLPRRSAQHDRLPPTLEPVFQTAKRHTSLKSPSKLAVTLGTVTATGSRLTNRYELQQKGRRTIRLPFFLDRHISALGLKQFAGMPDDTLFRKRGTAWEVVQDTELIDLRDPTVVLSLGTVTLLS